MGSWAEGCCISDLEIAPGDDIVIAVISKNRYESMNSGAYGQFSPATFFLCGSYDDYGGIDVNDSDENKALFLKVYNMLLPPEEEPWETVPETIRADDVPTGMHMWMARQDALRMLRTIRCEFVWEGCKTVGDIERSNLKEMSDGMADIEKHRYILEMWDQEREEDAKPRAFSNGHMKTYVLAKSVMNNAASNDIPVVEKLLSIILGDLNDLPTVNLCIKQIAEVQMVQGGLGELRKSLHPQFRTGPQYDGWLAVEDFTKYLNAKIREKKAKKKQSKIEQKEMMRRWNIGKAKFKEVHGREATTQEDNSEVYKFGQEAE